MERLELQTLKAESAYFIGIFIAIIAITKFAFSAETMANSIKLVSSIYWLWVLPGFLLTYLFELSFGERLVLGSISMLAIYGVGSYYFGLTGIKLGISIYLIPVAIIVIASFIIYRRLVLKKDIPAHPEEVTQKV